METLEFRNAVAGLRQTLVAFAYSLCRSTDDANDLAQETIAKALTKQSLYEEGTNLKAWLFTILRNTYYSRWTHGKREVLFDNHDALGLVTKASINTQPEDRISLGQVLTMMREQIERDYLLTFLLIEVKDYTYQEVADKLGISIGTVKSRVNRTRAKLVRILGGEAEVNAFLARA